MNEAPRTPIAGTPGVSARPDSRPRSFNPWRFGKVAIPAALRTELIGTKLPVIPPERLYGSGTAGEAEGTGPSARERRGALLAAGAVVLLFGAVMLGWAMLGRDTAEANEAPHGTEGSP